MNVSELARQLHINTAELLELLPQYGFDIGKKAIKIDDKTAQQVTQKWRFIKRDLEEKKRKEFEEKKIKRTGTQKRDGADRRAPPAYYGPSVRRETRDAFKSDYHGVDEKWNPCKSESRY